MIKKVKKMLYPLQPKQMKASNTFATFRLFGGAKGGGKSYWLRSEATKHCVSWRNIRGLILRRTYKEVYKNTVLPMLSELPKSLIKYNEQKATMTFLKTGSTIEFGYCRNMKDVSNYQGIEYDFIGIEELTHWQEGWFQILMSCLRTVKPGVTPNFFGTTNPGEIGHLWVKRLWVDRQFLDGEDPKDYAFIPSTIYDNQVLMKADPRYLVRLENLPEEEKKAFLYGDWNVFKGQYFRQYRKDLHEIEPFAIPEGWEKIICLDYWYSAPSAVYWLVKDYDGNVYIYREIYATGFLYDSLLNEINKYNKENVEILIADPALKAKSFDTNQSFFDKAYKAGFKVIGGTNDRVPGWNLMKEYLIPVKGPNGDKPKLQVFNSCLNFIRTFPTLIHDKTNVEDLNTQGEDHAADAVRYWLNYLVARDKELTKYSDINAKGVIKTNRVLGKTF